MTNFNMNILLFEDQVLADARKHKGHILIRQQRCIRCSSILAMEITDKLGARGEYWVIGDALHFKGVGWDILYKKEVWFGNEVKCPCGMEGKLPIDKPLNAEQIAKPKEGVTK